MVAFVAFANALAFTVVTLYVTPFTLTVAETVTLLLLVAFTALTAAVPFLFTFTVVPLEAFTLLFVTGVTEVVGLCTADADAAEPNVRAAAIAHTSTFFIAFTIFSILLS